MVVCPIIFPNCLVSERLKPNCLLSIPLDTKLNCPVFFIPWASAPLTDLYTVVVGTRVAAYAAAPVNKAPPAVAATVPQEPWLQNSSREFEEANAVATDVP